MLRQRKARSNAHPSSLTCRVAHQQAIVRSAILLLALAYQMHRMTAFQVSPQRQRYGLIGTTRGHKALPTSSWARGHTFRSHSRQGLVPRARMKEASAVLCKRPRPLRCAVPTIAVRPTRRWERQMHGYSTQARSRSLVTLEHHAHSSRRGCSLARTVYAAVPAGHRVRSSLIRWRHR